MNNTIQDTLWKLIHILKPSLDELIVFESDQNSDSRFISVTNNKERKFISIIQLGKRKLTASSQEELENLIHYINGYHAAVLIHRK